MRFPNWVRAVAVTVVVLALTCAALILLWLVYPRFYAWLGSWFIPWAETPGFGGSAAVAAAIIAFIAARHQAAQQRQANRKEQWWKRAQWALDTTLGKDTAIRTVGFRMLESLATSEYAAEHEGDVIAAATDRPIDEMYANGRPRIVTPVADPNGGSDNGPNDDESDS